MHPHLRRHRPGRSRLSKPPPRPRWRRWLRKTACLQPWWFPPTNPSGKHGWKAMNSRWPGRAWTSAVIPLRPRSWWRACAWCRRRAMPARWMCGWPNSPARTACPAQASRSPERCPSMVVKRSLAVRARPSRRISTVAGRPMPPVARVPMRPSRTSRSMAGACVSTKAWGSRSKFRSSTATAYAWPTVTAAKASSGHPNRPSQCPAIRW